MAGALASPPDSGLRQFLGVLAEEAIPPGRNEFSTRDAGRLPWMRLVRASFRVTPPTDRFYAFFMSLRIWTFTLLLLCGVACKTLPPAMTKTTFRVMTYNIHHGEGLDGKLDLERIAALIKQERADIVALQEVDRNLPRTARRDLPAELAKLTGLKAVFSNNYAFDGGEYGNAVLSRYPVTSWTNNHYAKMRAGEQRGLLQLRLSVAGRDLWFANTHLDASRDDAERLHSVGQMPGLLGTALQGPVIFCGDFNDTPASKSYGLVQARFADAWLTAGQGSGFTIPTRKATRRIDYIWHAGDPKLVPVKAWVPYSEASDHLPVMVEFEWR
jgi:endonuclease/exonuclease/phosphatase family metal-dependent hydrolase